jgi:hypothetical protein
VNAKTAYNEIAARLRQTDLDAGEQSDVMDLVNQLWDAADSEARINGLP